jgi:hypothetical protein
MLVKLFEYNRRKKRKRSIDSSVILMVTMIKSISYGRNLSVHLANTMSSTLLFEKEE